MLIGIDTYHKLVNKKNSCTGIVASLDPNFTKFYSRAAITKPGDDFLSGLAQIIHDCCKAYFAFNGKKHFPE